MALRNNISPGQSGTYRHLPVRVTDLLADWGQSGTYRHLPVRVTDLLADSGRSTLSAKFDILMLMHQNRLGGTLTSERRRWPAGSTTSTYDVLTCEINDAKFVLVKSIYLDGLDGCSP
jgi:hypothetical protein